LLDTARTFAGACLSAIMPKSLPDTLRLLSPRHLAWLLAALMLAACHSRDPATLAAGPSPEAAVRESITLLRSGDFDGFWRHALPPQDYAVLREDWTRTAPDATAPGTTGGRLDATLRELAAPDTATRLEARLQPWLAGAQARYADQLPLLVGIAHAIAANTITEQAGLSDTQKRDLTALLDALGPWAQQAPWFDPAKARQALDVAIATARALDLGDSDSLRGMDFDQAMRGYATVFEGLKQGLVLYGLSIDQMLASAHVVPLDYHPPYARVRIEYRLLDTPLSLESTLVQQDGRWYDRDLIETVRQAHRQRVAVPPTMAAPPD
jgi:hypothetical protein